MKQIVFLPALIAWLFFAPLFRLANYLYPDTKHSLWFWCGIEAKDHANYYDHYCEGNL